MTSLEFHCSFSTDPGERSRTTSFFDELMGRLCAHPAVLDAAIDADHTTGEATICLTMGGLTGSAAARTLLEEVLSASDRGDFPVRLTA